MNDQEEKDQYDIESANKINALFSDPLMAHLKMKLWEEMKKHDSSLDKLIPDMSKLYGNNHQEAEAILRDTIIPTVSLFLKSLRIVRG